MNTQVPPSTARGKDIHLSRHRTVRPGTSPAQAENSAVFANISPCPGLEPMAEQGIAPTFGSTEPLVLNELSYHV
jgi:hypothetical protein